MTHFAKKKIEELNRLSVDGFKQKSKISLVVVLDNVRSLHNVGSVFRTSDAYLVNAVYLCGITATPPHAEIHKTALGAENSVDWRYFENTLDAIQELKSDGYTLLAIEQVKGSCSLDEFHAQPDKKYAVVLGHEVHGVGQEIVDRCDACIELPQYGTKHSLNVSVTAGIIIWDFFRQLHC